MLKDYLALGTFPSNVSANEVYKEAIEAVFRRNVPCHRITQVRSGFWCLVGCSRALRTRLAAQARLRCAQAVHATE